MARATRKTCALAVSFVWFSVFHNIRRTVMANVLRVSLDEIVGYFDELEDPRSAVNLRHPFVSVVVIALMAVLAGAGGPTAIATWARSKADFLVQVLALPPSIPRKELFRPLPALLSAAAFAD